MSAISTLQHLSINQSRLTASLEKLSSGYRINSAADDAAGFAIAAKMEGTKGKLIADQENILSAQAMVKMADGAIDGISNIVKRLQVLATKAASEQNTPAEQSQLDKEAQKLLTILGNNTQTTTFNNVQQCSTTHRKQCRCSSHHCG
ncbi:MAG: flagellin [Zetaproteobacteria bacterium]|nr:flagellin [Zetaproteobacteria bacterium]